MAPSLRTFLIAGERREVALLPHARAPLPEGDLALAYGFFGPADDAPGWVTLSGAPWLERPLRLSRLSPHLPDLPLFAPFGRKPRPGFRELSARDPRLSRLWGRFSVDAPVALERDAKLFARETFDRPGLRRRVFIMEDGDRYAIRAVCVFALAGRRGEIIELLHDRTVTGMRGAAHVVGLALRAMSDDGAVVARACALSHSGTVPIFLRHAFSRAGGPRLAVRVLDRGLAGIVGRAESWYVSGLDHDVASSAAP